MIEGPPLETLTRRPAECKELALRVKAVGTILNIKRMASRSSGASAPAEINRKLMGIAIFALAALTIYRRLPRCALVTFGQSFSL